MLFKKLSAIALSLLSLSAFAAPLSQPIVMGYWTDWSPYWTTRPYAITGSTNSSGNPVSNPDFDAQMNNLNVLAYAFFEADANGVLQFADSWSDLSAKDADFCANNLETCNNQAPTYGMGNFDAFSQLKTNHPNLKRIISIGGASHDATFQSAFVNPTRFVNSVVALVNYYQLDGVDLDFEPTSFTTDDSNNYLKLAQQLRAALPNALITTAISPNPNTLQSFDGTTHNWQAFVKSVDYVSVMGYDFHGGWDAPNSTAFHSNLYSDPSDPYNVHYSIDLAVQTLKGMGVNAHQLVVGIPSYGRMLCGVSDNGKHGLYQPMSQNQNCTNTDLTNGIESYYSIMSTWLGKGFNDYWYSVGNNLSGIFAYNAGNQQFVSYDNTALIDAKVNYVKSNQLGGMMMWELRSDLSPNDPNNASLLKHMHDGLAN